MSTLFPKTITYKSVTGEYVNGSWRETGATSSTFQGGVQPLTGKDFEALPTGRGDKGMVKVYSTIELNVSQAKTSTPGDIIIWQGREWELTDVLPYQNDNINHYKYFAEYRREAS